MLNELGASSQATRLAVQGGRWQDVLAAGNGHRRALQYRKKR
jgi:hypothetical protein